MEKYTKITEKELPEINCKATIYKHNKTGARIATFDTADTNKVFAITFKTPAVNSTGVTHIIEHSVLCGSKKYPLKDPFVELLKGSLNTFLNAFTYPDKTMYPCASKNDKDFKNLMDIYLDAVFFPRMYTCKNVFLQEGWHYEIFKENEPIKYNGVVYNEMKGSFSNSDDVLNESILNGIFSDTTYKNVSGGNPDNIVDLTYEDFINFHKKYYSPSNSFIFLYGKMDMEERLEYLDKEYLSKFEKIDINPVIEDSKPTNRLKEETILYPVSNEETLENKTNLAVAYALGSALDIKQDIAFDVIDRILINSPSAILKERLLGAGIGDDISGGNQGGIKQSYFAIVAKNTEESKKEELLKIAHDTFVELVNGKLDHESVLAYLNNFEFRVRENKFSGYPLGLKIIMNSMDTWLYDDNNPFGKLNVLGYYEELKKDLEKGYFEDLIKKYLVNSDHNYLLIQKPSKTVQKEKEEKLAKKLEDFKNSLSKEEIKELIKMNEGLREYQSSPESIDAINSLPHLNIEDLRDKPDDYKCELIKDKYNFYYSKQFTNEVIYGEFLFKANAISYKKASELKFLTELLSKLPTKKHTNAELDKIIGLNFGDFDVALDIYSSSKSNDYDLLMGFSFSTLKESLNLAKDLSLEFINEIVFDEKKIFEVVGSEKSRLDSAVDYGHVLALTRSRRSYSIPNYIDDECNGVGYIDFINDLSKNFDVRKDALISDLKGIMKEIFVKENFLSFATLEDKTKDDFKKCTDEFFINLSSNPASISKNKEKFEEKTIKEGITCQAAINFVARTMNFEKSGLKYNGKMDVLSNALGIDYMWQNIRVKGGAYGAMFGLNFKNGMSITSYRDPHIKETDEAYKKIPEFIENMNYNDDDLLKLKIGAISNGTRVLHAKNAGILGFSRLLTGITYDDILKYREELLSTTNEDLKSFAPIIKDLIDESNLCVIGNENEVKKNSNLFEVVRKLS